MRKVLWAATAVVGAVGLAAAGDATAADVYALHGIPGEDLELPPELPVDIAVNGDCVVTGLNFGETAGPLALDPGIYEAEIFLAADEGCTGDLAIATQFSLGITDTAAVVAYLDQNKDATATKFTVSDQPPSDHNGRLAVYHTAAAPPVDIKVEDAHTGDKVAAIRDLRNGEQSFPADLPADSYEVVVSPTPQNERGVAPPVAEIPLEVMAGNVYAVFAVGSLDTSTFGVVPLVITP